MQFRCEKCDTLYALPDSRVAGRILKVRCRRCQQVNTVDGGALPLPETAPPHDPAPAPQPGPEASAAGTSYQPATEAAEEREGDSGAEAGGEEGDSPPADKSAETTEADREGTPDTDADPVGETAPEAPARGADREDGGIGRWSPSTVRRYGVDPGPPPESTRAALRQAGMARRAARIKVGIRLAGVVLAALLAALLLDNQGFIRIPFLHGAVDELSEPDEHDESLPQPKLPLEAVLSEDERAAIRRALLEGNAAEVARVRQQAQQRAEAMGVAVAVEADPAPIGGIVSASDLVRHASSQAAPVELDAGQKSELQGLAGNADKQQATLTLKPTVAKIKVPSFNEGGLREDQVARVVAQHQGGINYCATREAKRGLDLPPKLSLALTVVGYGKVADAHIVEDAHAQSTLGRCLVNKAKIWRFPSFTGEPLEIEIPLKFAKVN